MGLLFLAGQLIAWRQLAAQGVFLVTNPSSSFFYLLTALHGLHLLGGIMALLYVLVAQLAAFANHSIRRRPIWLRFTGISWMGFGCFLFALLYLGR